MLFEPRIVIPGDLVSEISEMDTDRDSLKAVILGPGLLRGEGASVKVSKPGVLRSKDHKDGAAFYWVDSHSRYLISRHFILDLI